MASSGVNNQSSGQRLGITEPISWSGPTEYDIIKTRELEKVKSDMFWDALICLYSLLGFVEGFDIVHMQFLADAGLYESHEEAIGREEVLGRLDQVGLHISSKFEVPVSFITFKY